MLRRSNRAGEEAVMANAVKAGRQHGRRKRRMNSAASRGHGPGEPVAAFDPVVPSI